MINQQYVDSFFPDVVGQNKVKRQLAFYLTSFLSTQVLPHLLIIGPKGGGKTLISTLVAKNLRVPDMANSVKPMLKINCATIRKLESLVSNVFNRYLKDHITLFFDEAHALDPYAQDALLTALNPDKNMVGYINYRDSSIEFDFKKVSFIFATTDPNKLSNPLKDRLKTIQLEAYDLRDIKQIIRGALDPIQADDDAIHQAALCCRNSPRQAVKMALDNIKQYLAATKDHHFCLDNWNKMRALLGINPMGVGEGELQVLQCLKGWEGRSLTSVSATTGLEKGALQNDYEIYLLKLGLLEITPKGRRLTHKGVEYLKEFDLLQNCIIYN